MDELLCRNRVRDYDQWRRVFDSHAEAHRQAGLELTRLWRDLEDPDTVFFLFVVESLERARAFLEDPAGAAAGEQAGVLDGDVHFLRTTDLY